MARKFISVEEYLGRRLTAGSYYQWMSRMLELMSAITTDNAQFASTCSEMEPLLTKLSLLIKQPGAFADTPAVTSADKWRDSLFTVIYTHIYYCSLLPEGSAFSAPGRKLFPQVKPYKSLQKHEMTQETTEITGFLRVLTAEGNTDAVAALGLTQAVTELGDQNAIIQNEMVKREQEDTARKQLKDGETTATLRAQIEPIYEVLVQMVNAFVVMGNASAAATVPEMNSVIDHYQQIQAQKDGGGSGSSSSSSSNNSGNTGDSGNGGNSGDSGEGDNGGNSGDSGNTGDSGDSGNGGNSGNTGDSGNSGSGDNGGDNGGGGSDWGNGSDE